MLLQRTPYNKTGEGLVEAAQFFASHGYVVALQDHRGRFASEGEFTKYIGEGQDGYDTIAYLADLPYSNGDIGMWGTVLLSTCTGQRRKTSAAGAKNYRFEHGRHVERLGPQGTQPRGF